MKQFKKINACAFTLGLKAQALKMDEFIKSFEIFSIKHDKQEFENSLDNIIYKSVDEEWTQLHLNYSKLKYLHELINKCIFSSEKFILSLEKFLINLDKITQYYLNQIDWENQEPDIQEDVNLIKNYFEESIKLTEPFIKLESVINGYNLLVPIVENFRNEKYISYIDDTTFIKDFNVKRRKR